MDITKLKGPLASIYERLYSKIVKGTEGKPKDIEYGAAIFPTKETGIIKGKRDELDFARSSIFRDMVNGPTPYDKKWPEYGTVHTHPTDFQGQSWMALPPSHTDWASAGAMPQGGKHLVWHPEQDMQDMYAITDRDALADFAGSLLTMPAERAVGMNPKRPFRTPSRVFDPTRWEGHTAEMTIPESFKSDETVRGAIMRALPLRLRDRGMVSVGNTGTPEENALLEQWAEDWGKRTGMARGGLVQMKGCNCHGQ